MFMLEFDMQTPDGSLLDILRNAYDILSQCDIKLPEVFSWISCNLITQINPVELRLMFLPTISLYCQIICWHLHIIWLFSSLVVADESYWSYIVLSCLLCRLKVMTNMLILDHHISSFCILLLAPFGRSRDKK